MPILRDPIWFPPLNVIHHFNELMKTIPDERKRDKNFRKAEELNSVAVMLVGVQELQGPKYWLQAVDDREGSPDVRTGTFVPPTVTDADDFSTQDVEVVIYEQNSPDGFLDFIQRTKLSKRKAYDAHTTILCHFKRDGVLPPPLECERVIAATGARCTVMVLGKLSPIGDIYMVAQIYPKIDFKLDFNLSQILKEGSHTGVLNLKWGQ